MADIFGTEDSDITSGTTGSDVIRLLGGSDTGVGDAGNDSIYGDAGNDSLFGDTTDVGGYYGTVGDDLLDGGEGDDLLRGGYGDDTLVGGLGNDRLYGEVGADLFVIDGPDPLGQIDTIQDFSQSDGDRLDLTRLGISEFATLRELISAPGAYTFIQFSSYGVLQQTFLSPVTLSQSDVVLSTVATADDRSGSDYSDDLFGGAGDDTLTGLAGNDRLFGEIGNDTLLGGDGTDQLFGGTGNDTLDGGSGSDVLSGGAGNDRLRAGPGSDALYGDAGADIFEINPVIDGFDGRGTAYYDTIVDFNRAQGDRLDVSSLGISEFATVEALLDFGDPYVNIVVHRGNTAFYTTIENITFLNIGDVILSTTVSDDNYTGSTGDDDLFGGLGNDTISGYFGADQIFGEGGDDRLYGQLSGSDYTTDADILDGGSGNDILTGGGGDDVLRGGADNDTLFGESGDDQLQGGTGNDSLSGGSGYDRLVGGDGNDLLAGGEGSDRLTGGLGADQFFVGGRDDQYNYATDFNQAEGDQINVALVGISEFDTVRALLDIADVYVELDVRFGGSVNRLILDGFSDQGALGDTDFVFSTTVADDSIEGTGSGDDLFGGLGNDTLIGNYGFDRLFGEGGNDRLFGTGYSAGSSETVGNYLSGGGGDDQLIGGYGGDTLLGGDGNDQLYGAFVYSGIQDTGDTLIGGAGDDTLSGEAGGDTLTGGDGADTFVVDPFGSQRVPDPVHYSGDIITDFAPGDFLDVTRLGISEFNTLRSLLVSDGTDTTLIVRFNGIESTATLQGVGALPEDLADFVLLAGDGNNDNIDGTYNADDLIAGLGNDTVRGNGGDDRIFGEGGDDILFGGDQSLLGGDGNDLLDGGAGDDQLNAGDGNNTVLGGAGDDVLVAGSGNDILGGGAGADTLTGGAGFNTFIVDVAYDSGGAFDGYQTEIITDFKLDFNNPGEGDILDISRLGISEFATVQFLLTNTYSSRNGPVQFNVLTDGNVQTVQFENNTYADQFSAADFRFNTDTAGGTRYGFAGNDHVFGGLGDNRLYGAGGDDTLFGEGGDDALFGGNFRAGGAPEYGFDRLFGGGGNDYLQGDGGADFLDGGTGNDTLRGGDQGDELLGGDGNDTLIGGTSNDTLDGGDGIDIAVFNGNIASFRIESIGALTIVEDLDPTDLDLGADGLSNIEFIQFDDTLVALGAADVVAVDDTATVSEDGGRININVVANDLGSGTLTLLSFVDPGLGQFIQDGNVLSFNPLDDFQALGAGRSQNVTVSYTVSNGTSTDTGQLQITVQGANDAPVTVLDSRIITEDTARVTLDVLANDSDVDGDTLTLSAITQPALGSVAIVRGRVVFSTGTAFQNLDTGEFSTQTFTYTVSDGTASTTQTVRVRVNGANDAPVALLDSRIITEDTATVTIDVLANDSDVDGDALTVTAVTQPALGSVTIVGGQVVFSTGSAFQNLDTGEFSTQTFTYTVSDGTATATQTVRVRVNGANDAPVAVLDSRIITEDTDSVVINVLANDSDVDGDTLTVTSITAPALGSAVLVGNQIVFSPGDAFQNLDVGEFSTQTFSYTVTDGTASVTQTVRVRVNGANDAPVAVADLRTITEDTATVTIDALANDTDVDVEALTITAVTQPALGSVAIVGNQLVFTTGTAFQGLDTGEQSVQTFAYTVSDGTATSTANVSVTVTGVNDAPVATDDTATVGEDTASVSVDVLANDTDVDGETLTVTTVTQPTLGSAAVVGGQVVFSTGTVFQGLDDGETSVQTVIYTISDGTTTDAGVLTVTVTGANDRPVAVDDSLSFSADIGSTILDVLGNDIDVDGDTLTVVGVTQPSLGTVSIVGGQVVFTTGGAFDGLAAGATSVQTFSYEVSDGTVTDQATVSVTITGVGGATDLVDDSATISENAARVRVDVLANDVGAAGFAVTAVTQPTLGAATIVGGQVVFSTGGAFEGLDTGETSVQTITYTASNGTVSQTATLTVTVTGANDRPDAVNDTATIGEDAATSVIDVLANDTDVDGETLTVTAVTQPSLGSVAIVGGQVVFATDGAFDSLDTGDVAVQTFTYTLTDGTATDTATVSVTIIGANDAPDAINDVARMSENTATVSIDVLANDIDLDAEALTITALTQPTSGSVAVVNGEVVFSTNRAFEALGAGETSVQTFSYTVTDGTASDTATVSVTVVGANDRPVTVADIVRLSENAGATTIDVLANDSDIDGDALTLVSVTDPSRGSVEIVGGQVVFTPGSAFDDLDTGEFAIETLNYVVTDGLARANGTLTVRINGFNDRPDAVDDVGEVAEDQALFLNVLLNDTDVDGDALTITAVTQPTLGTVSISQFGGGIGVPPTDVIAFDASGAFDFLGQGETSVQTFTYTVSDGTATDTATVSVTVTGVNDAPDLIDDAATLGEDDGGVDIDVLANDSDRDGDTLTLAAISAPTRGTATIQGGVVVFDTNGDFDFLAQGETATEILSYTVSDGTVTSTATLTVTVTGTNDAPVAVADSAEISEDSAVQINVVANDRDADGGLLSVIDVSAPGRGTVQIIDNQVLFTAAGAFDDLAAGETATEVLIYTLSDGDATSTAEIAITITGVNDAPVAADDLVTTAFGTPVTIDAAANDFDVEGDTLTVSALGNGAHGTVELVGNQLRYTPDSGFVGSDSFSYQVSDGQGGSSTGTVFVIVDPRDNIAPDARDDTAALAEDGTRLINVLGNDIDEDGDTLTIAAFGQGAHGSVALVGNQLQYTPDADFNGTDSFTYTVDDGFGGSDTATVSVTVRPVNDAPTAQDDQATVAEDRSVVIRVLDNDIDIDGDTLALATVGFASHGTVEQVGRLVRYTPDADFNGTDSFVYTVRDPRGQPSLATAFITVTPVNDAPVAVADVVSVTSGIATSLNVLGNDTDIDGDGLSVGSFTQGEFGRVTRDGEGDLVYRALGGFVGTDSFDYTVIDGQGGRSTTTVTVEVEAAPPSVILGTEGRDRLRGTAGDDILDARGGSGDLLRGLGGNDVFDFSNSVDNGVREKKFVLDYQVGHDQINLGGALITDVQEFSDRVVLSLDFDGDVLVVQGVSTVFDITFFD